MERKEFDAERIREVCVETGFNIMGFIDLLDQQSTSITFYADGSVTQLPERGRDKIIGRIKFSLKPTAQARTEQEQTKPDPIKLGEIMALRNRKSKPKPKNLENLPFAQRFDDINDAEVGDYVFANGVISKDPHAAEILTGIIGWINPDPHAPIGYRAYVITPETIQLPWAEKDYFFGFTMEKYGSWNTRKLLDNAKMQKVKLPAAEYCASYTKRGVRAGDGFLAAINLLEVIAANEKVINQSLEKIGGDPWKGWVWSSSEYSLFGGRIVRAKNGKRGCANKTQAHFVRCIVPL